MLDETGYHLRSLDPAFAPYAAYLVAAARAAGIPLLIISGRRAWGAPDTRHADGRAIDVQVMGYTRDQIPFWWWEALGRFWEAMGGRWGGRFSSPDVNHFDAG